MANEHSLHPGKILKERFLDPLGITPYRLAKNLGVHVRRVSELVKGNRRMTPDTAIRLGLFFDVPPLWWLEMQARYDVDSSTQVNDLRERVRPYEDLANVLITPSGVRRPVQPGDSDMGAVLISVPDEFLQRLRAQVAHVPPRAPREVRTVVYESGSTALVGGDQ